MTEKWNKNALKKAEKAVKDYAREEIKDINKEVRSCVMIFLVFTFVSIFLVGDFVSIYPVIEKLASFAEGYVHVFLTVMAVIILDYTPVLISSHLQKFLHYRKIDKAESVGHLVWIVMLSVMLIFLFVILFLLRWEGKEDLYREEYEHTSIRGKAIADTFVVSQGQKFFTIFMGMLPIFSTLFIFALTYPANLNKIQMAFRKIRLVKLEKKYILTKARIKTLEEARNTVDELELEHEIYQVTMRLLNHMEQYAKLRSDIPLLKEAKDPDVVSRIGTMRSTADILLQA